MNLSTGYDDANDVMGRTSGCCPSVQGKSRNEVARLLSVNPSTLYPLCESRRLAIGRPLSQSRFLLRTNITRSHSCYTQMRSPSPSRRSISERQSYRQLKWRTPNIGQYQVKFRELFSVLFSSGERDDLGPGRVKT